MPLSVREAQAGDSIVVPVSVNVSRAHLKDTDFVQKVKQLLIRYGVHPSLMEFELTETMLAESMEEAAAVIRGLRALGCKVSIDDFGTGYSALNLLKELEFDILKLDGSFVSGAAAEGYKSDVILRNIIRMADELYMTVLCEGLETAGQVERLNTFGCTLAQGYYFAQPMPAESVRSVRVQQAGGYCALPWGGADGAQRLPDYCEASALTDSAVRCPSLIRCLTQCPVPWPEWTLPAGSCCLQTSSCSRCAGIRADRWRKWRKHFLPILPQSRRRPAFMRKCAVSSVRAGRCDTKLPVRRADGSVIWVRMTATYAGSPEWGRYLLCFFYDITREQTGTAAKSRDIKQLSEERDFYAGMLEQHPVCRRTVPGRGGRTVPCHSYESGRGTDTGIRKPGGLLEPAGPECPLVRSSGRQARCVGQSVPAAPPGRRAQLRVPAGAPRWFGVLGIRDASDAVRPGGVRYSSRVFGFYQQTCASNTVRASLQALGACCRGRSCLNMNTVRTCLPLPALQNRAWNCRSARRLSSPRSMPGAFPQPFASYAACIAQALEEDGDDVCGAERRIELPGGGIWVRVSLVAVRGSSGARESAVGCIMDVTPQHEDRARLLRLTQTDSLTGVLNKRTTRAALPYALGEHPR